MADYFGSAMPYVLVGAVAYLIFRAVIWLLYYKGDMRVPFWHEAGFALLALCLFFMFAAAVTPALGFSAKPLVKDACFIPVKGTIALVKAGGVGAILGVVLKYMPLGFLIPLLFRRFQNFLKTAALCGGIALFVEVFQLFLEEAAFNIDEFLWSLPGIFIGYFLFALLCWYMPEMESVGTVKRSRRREVPFPVKKELEILVLLLLLAVIGKGTQLESTRVKEEKAAQEKLEQQQEEARRAAEEAEAQRLAEEEARKLKVAENMPALSLEAGSACLFSVDDDMILYEKNSTQRVAPASTAKLLTALTVLKYCGLDELVTAGEEINLISEGSSTASLKLGTSGTVNTFLGAMLLPSGNDAAYVLAKHAGYKILGGEAAGDDTMTTAAAIEAFVEAMNAYAAELELEDSNFVNPDGDAADDQYTTARDMVRIARACLEDAAIMDLCGRAKFRALFENMDVTYQNSNLLVQPASEYYYEGAIGLKTGTIQEMRHLIGALELNGKRYVTAVLQDSEEGRWKDTKILFDEAAGVPAETE